MKNTWELAFPFLFKLKMLVIEDQPRKTLSLKQCLFNCRLPNSLRRFNLVWALLCGIVLWSIWIEWNDLIFNLVKWWDARLRRIMWDSLLNYGRVEWKHTLAMIQKYPKKKCKILELFDKSILPSLVICIKDGRKIMWCYQSSTCCSILW